MKRIYLAILIMLTISQLSGCIAVTAVGAAVSVTATVVEGTVDVVDAVTPDVFSDDDDDDEDEDEDEDENEEE